MDPLSALAIACSVMQVISFSKEIISTTRKIREEGAVDVTLEDNAEGLSKSSNTLKEYLGKIAVRNQAPVTGGNEAELRDVAAKCLKTSEDISMTIREVEGTRGGNIMKALKFRRKRGLLADLEKKMQSYRNRMDTDIMLHLCDRSEAASISQSESFQSLDGELKMFIQAYCEGQKALLALTSSEA